MDARACARRPDGSPLKCHRDPGILVMATIAFVGLISCGDSDGPSGPARSTEASGEIRGTVETPEQRDVHGARVEVAGSDFTADTLSGSDGEFAFPEIPPASYEVAVIPPAGYRTDPSDTVSVTIQEGESQQVDFVLEEIEISEDTIAPGRTDTLSAAGGIQATVTAGVEAGRVRAVLERTEGLPEAADSVAGGTARLLLEHLSSNAGVSAADVGLATDARTSTRVTLAVPRPDSSSASMHFVFRPVDVGRLPRTTLFGNADRTERSDPETAAVLPYARSTRPLVVSPGGTLELNFGVSFSDATCGDEYRRVTAAPDGRPLGERIPVVLIHGWQPVRDDCPDFSAERFHPYRDKLRHLVDWLRGAQALGGTENDRAGQVRRSFKFYTYRYPTNTSFLENGDYLAGAIEERVEQGAWSRVILVGHSMGGLVGRRALLASPSGTAGDLLTLGSPHEGTVAADLAVKVFEGGEVALERCSIEVICPSVRAMLASGILPWPLTPGLRDLQTDAPSLEAFGVAADERIQAVAGSLSASGLVEAGSVALSFPGLLLWTENGDFGDGLVPSTSATPEYADSSLHLEGHDHFELRAGNDDGDRSRAARIVRDAILSMCRSIARELGRTDASREILAASGQPRSQPPSYLYSVEAISCGRDERVAKIRTPSGVTPFIADLAEDAEGTLWGASFDTLYRIDRADGTARSVAAFTEAGVNALDFAPSGTLFGATQNAGLLVTEPGDLVRIDTASAETAVIGSLGSDLEPAGDLAFGPEGSLYGTVRRLDGDTSMLARIDTATGMADVVGEPGALGFEGVFGLDFVDGSLFGLTAQVDGTGELVRIDLQDGTGTAVRPLDFWAAGAADERGPIVCAESECWPRGPIEDGHSRLPARP